jgi:hypothetical protein
MRDLDKQLAYARMSRDISDRRQAEQAAAAQSGPEVTAEQREMRTGDLFRETFGHKRIEPQAPGPDRPQDRPWDAALRLADDDTPAPPEAPEQPLPVVLTPPEETRARQSSLSAEDLFAAMEQRLSITPEAATLPPEVAARRAFRELPGPDRDRLAALVEQQDYGMVGYFDGRNLPDDYRAFLVGSALAKRLQDARRLQPDLSPDALVRAMLEQG